MTLKGFYSILFLQAIVLTALKVIFFKYFNYSDPTLQVEFLAITVVPMFILARYLGVMSFFEAFFTVVFWIILDLLADVLVTSGFIGASVFSQGVLWSGYGLIALTVLIAHKKRHVHIRNELHAKKHAAAHAHEHGHEPGKH